VYAIVYLDAIQFKVRDNGHFKNKATYLAIGLNMDGLKEVLRWWIAQTEGVSVDASSSCSAHSFREVIRPQIRVGPRTILISPFLKLLIRDTIIVSDTSRIPPRSGISSRRITAANGNRMGGKLWRIRIARQGFIDRPAW
jgi:hypothetical protein